MISNGHLIMNPVINDNVINKRYSKWIWIHIWSVQLISITVHVTQVFLLWSSLTNNSTKTAKPVNKDNINTHLKQKTAPGLIRWETAFPCFWFVRLSELEWEFECSGGNTLSGEGKVTDRRFLLFNRVRLMTVHANTSDASLAKSHTGLDSVSPNDRYYSDL